MSGNGLFDLNGKVAVVTGTNRGIGKALADGLAEAGADIIHMNRSPDSRCVEDVRQKQRDSTLVQLDLESPAEQLEEAVEAAASWKGRVDILVNSAGIIVRKSAVEQTTLEVNRVLQIDLVAPFHLSVNFARHMMDEGYGRIVNIASLMNFQGGQNVASYAMAKSGIGGMTRALANEWAQHGIRVNGLAPGYIATDINEELHADRNRAIEFEKRIPVGRWGHPRDLIGGAIFLASDAAEYVNGEILVVDGGWLAR